MRADVENPHLVPQQQCNTQSITCTGFTQCYRRWPLQEESVPVDRVVPLSTDFQENFQNMGESPGGPFRNQPEQKALSLYLSDPRRSGLGSRCPQHSIGKPGCVCFFSHCPSAQGCTKTLVSSVQDNPNRPRLADKTVVLGDSGDVSGHTQTTTTHSHSAQTTYEQPLLRQPNFLESPCLVSRSSMLQQHSFNAEVAERIAAPQRLSTRAICSSKWTVF